VHAKKLRECDASFHVSSGVLIASSLCPVWGLVALFNTPPTKGNEAPKAGISGMVLKGSFIS
jgi:hypothetical protein